MTVLYLSASIMCAVGGKGGRSATVDVYAKNADIKKYIFNGTVIDKEAFKEAVTIFFEENKLSKKDVTLIMNMNQIMTRIIKVPIKSDAEMLEYVKNEFSNVERVKEPVCGYYVLTKDKKTKLCDIAAFLADKGFLDAYAEIFDECGIKVTSIKPARLAAIRALKNVPGIKDSTAVVQLMEGTGFTNLLFVNGEYIYASFSRMFNTEAEPSEKGMELADAISRIMQFTQSQHIDCAIENILFAGLSDEDIDAARTVITSFNPQMNCNAIEKCPEVKLNTDQANFGQCIYLIGGMLDTGRMANLLAISKKNGSADGGAVDWIRMGLTLGGLIVLCAGIYGVALFLDKSAQAELAQIEAWSSSPEVQEQIAEAKKLESRQADAKTRLSSAEEVKEKLSTYPILNADVINKLNQCAGGLVNAAVSQYNSKTGEMLIDCRAQNVDLINQFIDNLSKEKVFASNTYSGYEYLEESKEWSVDVTVELDSTAGHSGVNTTNGNDDNNNGA